MTTRFIVNPAAGGGRCGKRLDALMPTLTARHAGGEVVRTTAAGHATELARQAVADGVDRIVVVGGDGTGFEVLNGLLPASGPLPELAYLPLGTGNSFIRDLGIDSEQTAMAALANGSAAPVDVLHAHASEGDFYSINLISAGFTANVGEVVNRRFKGLGALGYVAGVLARLATLHAPVIPIRLDNGPLDERGAVLLSLSNSRCTGGTMAMAPNAQIDDGLLDVIRVGPMSRLRLLTAFPRIFAGTHIDMPEVDAATARTVRIEHESPVDWMVDGEILRRTLAAVTVMPGAVRVVR